MPDPDWLILARNAEQCFARKQWPEAIGFAERAVAINPKCAIAWQAIGMSLTKQNRILEAIEAGDFKRLPGGIYNTNYIRQYANAIEFDAANLLAFYHDSCRNGSAPTLQVQYS